MKLPKVEQQYFAFEGGLDQVTPAIALSSGYVIDAQNFEPDISGGYRRINGYERFDGRPSPSSALYWLLNVSITGVISVGDTIFGVTSGATAKVLQALPSSLVLGRVTGTFLPDELLMASAVIVATSTSTAMLTGEPTTSGDADYTLLATNDLRGDIGTVPGSGPIRGVWLYADNVYAFRNNEAGTQGLMFKATPEGWVQINFANEISFAAGAIAPVVGQTIKGGSSGATGTVLAVVMRSGAWSGTAVGTIVYSPVSGSFVNGEAIKDAGTTTHATSSSVGAPIKRLPGGQMEFITANFTGSVANAKMYGCDGVNTAFEFDGAIYVPIHTGMAVDTPSHLIFHRFYLFLSFLGSVQFSALGNPYAWTTILGSGEIALGEYVTGFIPQGGNVNGSTLGIFTKNRTYMLYGSTSANFNLVASVYELGYSAFTLQPASNLTFGLTSRGIQSLITTLTYGDFDYAAVSHLIQPFIFARRGMETASTSLRGKDQYRVYFNDGYGLVVGITADKVSGILPINYGRPVRCMATQMMSTGREATFFGSDDGYVYQDNVGTSFDGGVIDAWIRLPFNHSKSPRVRKRYRRAVFEVRATGYAKINVTYDLGYGNPDVLVPVAIVNNQILPGGYWDQFTWDALSWDGKAISDISMPLSGTEKNISFLFYSSRAQDSSFTVQGATVSFTPQRVER